MPVYHEIRYAVSRLGLRSQEQMRETRDLEILRVRESWPFDTASRSSQAASG
jgi:hypothetical protein